MVLFPGEVHVSRTLRRTLNSREFTVTLDRAFDGVIQGCAAPRTDQDGTWITREMMRAYSRLATLGYAHSVEVWKEQELAGGLYGVGIGRMFYGESMFSRRSNTSKVALVSLARQLDRWGFDLIDCQMSTGHLASLGAREIPRHEFLRRVHAAAARPPVPSPWIIDPDLGAGTQ
jgi:leucyl/phenylalanyl-tRNA--protein transferase